MEGRKWQGTRLLRYSCNRTTTDKKCRRCGHRGLGALLIFELSDFPRTRMNGNWRLHRKSRWKQMGLATLGIIYLRVFCVMFVLVLRETAHLHFTFIMCKYARIIHVWVSNFCCHAQHGHKTYFTSYFPAFITYYYLEHEI